MVIHMAVVIGPSPETERCKMTYLHVWCLVLPVNKTSFHMASVSPGGSTRKAEQKLQDLLRPKLRGPTVLLILLHFVR